MDAVIRLLNQPTPHYVIVFVHGWRHDAGVGNQDVQRFRLLLAYARRFLNQRCIDKCEEKELLGVYVGWRGRSFNEPQDREAAAWVAGASPTLWKRKKLSDDLAPALMDILEKISEPLELGPQSSDKDHMLTIGHSFGGNMLATGLQKIAVDAIDHHEVGDTMDPLFGNLIVLINPASEASKWTAIQRKLRAKTGMPNDSSKERDTTALWQTLFPSTQKPIYISLTASKHWSRDEAGDIRRIKYDLPTQTLFPWAYLLRQKERRTTIGHLHPFYPRGSIFPRGPAVGTTHELILNVGSRRPTNYESVMVAENAHCEEVAGWLTEARRRWGGWVYRGIGEE